MTLDKSSPEETLMSIGALARKAGVSSRTIRYYEELGILPTPNRSPGGTRKYPGEYVFYLEGALALKELGFTLDEIKILGELALGRQLSITRRGEAGRLVQEKMQALEDKIHVLERLRAFLLEQRAGMAAVPLVRLVRPPAQHVD
jgi:DNA-binding transcriptional MerR regulator